MTRKFWRRLALVVCLSFVTLVLLAGCVLITTRIGCVRTPAYIYVKHGTSYQALLDSLTTDRKIRYKAGFDYYAKYLGLDTCVRAGRYELSEGMSYVEVARMFKLGLQTPLNITFNNARDQYLLAQKLAPQIEPDSAAIVAAFNNPELHAKLGVSSAQELFGMIIPNTYEVYWSITPEEFLSRMKQEYDQFWTPERVAKAEALHMTRSQVVTLASIVYEETAKVDEMPTVAGVYVNRLRIGMPLQADPTVKYAIGDYTIRRITHKMLRVDSPYNTYRHAGLPPTPICMPSIAAIDAVLNYRHHNYLYFCAKEDFSGYHNFAVSYKEHRANAKKYATALDQRGIK